MAGADSEGFVRLEVVDPDAELEAGTDAALLADGWATLTALEPICESATAAFDAITADALTTRSLRPRTGA